MTKKKLTNTAILRFKGYKIEKKNYFKLNFNVLFIKKEIEIPNKQKFYLFL